MIPEIRRHRGRSRPGGENQRAASHNLHYGPAELHIEIVKAQPGDHQQFDSDNQARDRQRRVNIRQQKRERAA
jgi:hypothetical protein